MKMFVDLWIFAMPTKPPSTFNMPTNKEFNVVMVMVQASDDEGFTLPSQNVTILDK
jgi:hypothetical protein